MLLILFNGGQSPAGGVNVRDVITRLLPSLHCYRLVDLQHWTEAELLEWATQELQRLAVSGVFTERSTVATVANQQAYAYPARHIHTIFAALNGVTLRPATVAELSALDDAWETASGAVERIIPDFEGVDKFAVYKTPTAGGQTITLIYCQSPEPLEANAPTVSAPAIIADYTWWAMLREARRKETDAQMPEVSAHAAERLALFEEAFRDYWGLQNVYP